MFIPENRIVGVCLTIVAMIGWATQNNAVVASKSPAPIYHLHFIIWRFIWTLVIACVFGSSIIPPSGDSIWSNIKYLFRSQASTWLRYVGASFVAGFTDMFFQIFLLSCISAGGLANTIPLQIGLSTLIGSIFTYIVERKAKLAFYIPGILFNIIAIVVNNVTYSLNKDQQKETEALLVDVNQPTQKFSVMKLTTLCLIGAVLAAFWGPCTAVALGNGSGMNPYTFLAFTSFFSVLTAPPLSYYFMNHPFGGRKSSFKEWIHSSWKDEIFPACWGGLCWSLGSFGYGLGASITGVAVAYVLSQSTPFISALYAIFLWKEFKHASAKTWTFESIMLLCLATSITFLCLSMSFVCSTSDS